MPLRGAHTRNRRMTDAVLGTYFQAQLFKRLWIGLMVWKEMSIKSGNLKHQDHNWISIRWRFMFHSGSCLVSSKLSPIPYACRAPEERKSLPHALVLPCSAGITVPVADPVRVNPASSVCILPLGSSIRETMCIHACAHNTNCTFEEDTVQNSGLLGESTPFYVLGRREGYPPRVAWLELLHFVSYIQNTNNVVKTKFFMSFIFSFYS